jgi:hypothetical protein
VSQTLKTKQFVDHNPSADMHLAQSGLEKITCLGSAGLKGGNPSVCLSLSFLWRTMARGSDSFLSSSWMTMARGSETFGSTGSVSVG